MGEEQDTWNGVDRFIDQNLHTADAALDACLKNSHQAGLPEIQVSPAQGKLLHLLVQSIAAKSILEIGTLGGYSAIWMCRALPPGGRLISLEINPACATVAMENIQQAGLSKQVEIRMGPALEALPRLKEEEKKFEFVFIDADKENNPAYFEWALKMTRPGSLIVVDNAVRDGFVLDEKSTDPSIRGTRRLYEAVGKEKRVNATAIQTVGQKGYDGFLLARVIS